jgi:hypothetical protein
LDEQSETIFGTLSEDGTLKLDKRPSLAPRPVEVTIRLVVAEEKGESWFECLQRSRAELETSGHRFRTKEEIDADLAADRDWGEDRFDEIYRQIEEERLRNNHAGGPSQASDILP